MSQYSSSSSTRTPGLVLAGVVILGVAAGLSLPFPLLGGLLITPALLVAAITSYLNRPSSRAIALAASVAALLIDLLSIILIFTQPSSDLAFLSALHSIYGFFCFLCALTGTALIWLGRQHQPSRSDSDMHTGTTSASTGWARESTGSGSGRHPRPRLREDLSRVASATAQGARRTSEAWVAYQRFSEPRRQRAAARTERREQRRAAERELQIRLRAGQRSTEEQEIHKARLRQARSYNSKFWF